MKLLEYEAKSILKRYGITVPKSAIIRPGDTPFIPSVLKSQVPTGGRGKAGGIRFVKDLNDATLQCDEIFQLEIKSFRPTILLAEEVLEIEKEFYICLLVNRDSSSIQLLCNREGGVEVETNSDDSFLRVDLPNHKATIGEQLAEYLSLPDKTFTLQDLGEHLYTTFVKSDATLIEINPLVLTKDGRIVAGDAKMELDNAAGFRHTDWDFEDKPSDTNFVTLDEQGLVATVANGAGLAMATVDAVASAGLRPANFLDIGGGASEESVLKAFQRIQDYSHVSAIVINIFAGITRCDEIARAIVSAQKNMSTLPTLYIRLAGTNYTEAKEVLDNANISLLPTLEACLEAVKKDIA